MQVHVTLLAFAVILVVSIESKPIWPNLYVSSYQYSPETVAVQPQLLQYQQPPYYVYNVHTDVNAVPAAVVAHGKPATPHVPAYSFYYGSPVYDFRFPFSPLFPVLKPGQPGVQPKETPPTTTTMKPGDQEEKGEDGIEKLDTKVDPEKEMQKAESEENSDDDSITIDSI